MQDRPWRPLVSHLPSSAPFGKKAAQVSGSHADASRRMDKTAQWSEVALTRLNTCLPIPHQQAWPSCAAQNAGMQHAVIELSILLAVLQAGSLEAVPAHAKQWGGCLRLPC